jgi:hypothetical protein
MAAVLLIVDAALDADGQLGDRMRPAALTFSTVSATAPQ